MSTSDKLTYLATTKDKLKTAINYTGANITTDTFRSYPEKLYNKYIDIINNGTGTLYSNMPKVNGQGSSLTLNNTESAPMLLSLYGDTQQDSTTGKNYANFDTYTNDSKNGIALTTNGSEMFINGTASADSTWSFSNLYNSLNDDLVGQNIVVSCYIKSGTITGGHLRLWFSKSGTWYWKYLDLETQGQITFTLEEMNSMRLTITSGVVATNLKLLVQIEKGNTKTSYEPYTNGASPNPDYPQPIHNVSGDNTIEICGKNLFDKSKVTTNYRIGPDGEPLSAIGYSLSSFIKVLPNTTYVRNLGITTNNAVALYDSNKTFISRLTSGTSFTTTNETYYVRTSISTTSLDEMQLEQGNQSSTYEAYTGNSQLISLGVENLFDKDNANVIDGYINSSLKITSYATNHLIYIQCKPNTTYTIEKYVGASGITIGYAQNQPALNDTIISRQVLNGVNQATITTPNNTNYLLVLVYNDTDNSSGKTLQEILAGIQIEKGSKSNSYSPYGASYIELNKISTYQDYIHRANDRWYLHKEIGKVVLNGSEDNWANDNSGKLTGIVNNDVKQNTSATTKADGYCNFYTIDTLNNSKNNTNQYSVYSSSTTTRIYFNNNNMSLNDFKTWLSTHNTIVYYVLAEATDTEITDTTLLEQLNNLEQIKSKKNQTNINQENNDLPFIITASAIKEYE